MQPVINSATEAGRATTILSFIWSVAGLLRRLDCLLEPSKPAVLEGQTLRNAG